MGFYVDGVLRADLPGDGSGTYEWSWDTRDLEDGTHVLSAVAYDQPGNQAAVSNSVTVDNTGPTVSIAEPTSGSTVLGFVETRTLASDPAGVAVVRFYVDGEYEGSTSTLEPDGYYHWTWDTRFAVGGRELRAEAVDALGNAASHTVSVTVVADAQGPGVSILSPLDGSTVNGFVHVQVAAYDPSRIGYVRFYINETLRANVSTPQADGYYYWIWDARYENGSRALRAEAVDTLGNSASQQIAVIADNNFPPEVYIALPLDGATVSGTSLKVVASASDPDGTVVQVRFIRDGILEYADAASPWDWTFDTTRVANGWHTLWAEAVDNWLARAFSEPISVCVRNGGPGCYELGPMGMASVESTVVLGAGPASAVVTGLWSQGSNHTLEVDLRKGALDLSASERDTGILGPSFGAYQFHNYTMWRLVIRDWSPGNSGTLVSFLLRTEETSDPTNPDTDGDGIQDGTEVHVWGTLPVAQDSDGDGLTDDYEVTPHSLVLTIDGVSTTLPPFTTEATLWDTDGDGLGDGEERTLGADRVVTHPISSDTDDDGLWDGYTVGTHLGELSCGANATLTDTDADTFSDSTEATPRDLTLSVNGTNEVRSVTTRAYTNDSDGDGLTDNEEWYGTSAYGVVTDPSTPDTDGDGLLDGQELFTTTVKTPSRYPFPAGGETTTEPISLDVGAPGWAVTQAMALVGITEPDMGEVGVSLLVYQAGQLQDSYVLKMLGMDVGEANNFTSHNLLQLGLTPGDLLNPSESFVLLAYDNGVHAGQVEYLQIQVTSRMLPNRADTDSDGLNDSEEVTLGQDGYLTNPWMGDTDVDGVADGLESNGWSWSGSTIIANPSGFKTDPARTDTDRDGVADGQDYVPTGDAFVQITLNSIVVLGMGASDGDSAFQPFGSITVGSETSYSPWVSAAPGIQANLNHQYTVNVPDDVSSVSITIRAWDYDTRIENGNHDDVHQPLNLTTDTSYGGCSGVALWVFTYVLGTTPPPLTSTGYCPGADSRLRADPITVTVGTVVPPRVETLLVVPRDYSGIYNVTNSNGDIVSRRYVGEPRFVAILVNVSGVVSFDPKVILVPRSVFFDTQLYHMLATQDVAWLPSGLAFRQNASSATSNSDGLQEILSGNVSGTYDNPEYAYLLNLLEYNATWNVTNQELSLADTGLADSLFLYSLPDDALRFVGYGRPIGESSSRTYRFCTAPNCGANPVPTPLWEQIWDGIVSTVTSWIVSAVVLAVNAFAKLVEILAQVGSWVADQIASFPDKVASAAQAAAEILDQLVDWIVGSVATLVNTFLQAFVTPLTERFSRVVGASELMAMTVQSLGLESTTSPDFVSAYAGFVASIADVLLYISTFQFLLLAVDIGLTALSFTGFGSLIAIAAEVAVTVAFTIVASRLVTTIESAFLDVLQPALVTSALVLAILGAFVAVTSAITPQWTETTYDVVRNDFRAAYGDLVDQVKIRPVVTQETQRVYSQTAGSGTAILLSVVAILIASSQFAVLISAVDPMTKAITVLILDVVAMVFGIWAVADAARIPPLTSMSRWSKALAPVSLGVSVALFGVDLLEYEGLSG